MAQSLHASTYSSNFPYVIPLSRVFRLDTITNLSIEHSGVEDRFAFAHKIALDLFRYMASFSQGTEGEGMMVVPNTIFDRWMERFERKYSMDPNFMMKEGV